MTDVDATTTAAAYGSDFRISLLGIILIVVITLGAMGSGIYAVFRGFQPPVVVVDPREVQAKSVIADITRDPASVQFRDVNVVDQCVTGQVNAKNAYGGYVGFHDFYYSVMSHKGEIDIANRIMIGKGAMLAETNRYFSFLAEKSNCLVGKPVS